MRLPEPITRPDADVLEYDMINLFVPREVASLKWLPVHDVCVPKF